MKRNQNFQDQIIFTVQSKYREALDRSDVSYLSRQSYAELLQQGLDKKDIMAAIENFLSLTRGSLREDSQESLINMKKKVEDLIAKISSKIKE